MNRRLSGTLVTLLAVFLAGILLTVPVAAGPEVTGTISGTVTDMDNSPVSNVIVYFYRLNAEGNIISDGLNYWAYTDANGFYQSTVPAMNYKILFDPYNSPGNLAPEYYHDRYRANSADTVTVPADGAVVVNESLARGGLVSGVVTDKVTGLTLSGVTAYASPCNPDGSSDDSRPYRTATSDSQGNYALRSISPGLYIIRFHHTDSSYLTYYYNGAWDIAQKQVVEFATGQSLTVNATLEKFPVLTGRVLGEPDKVPLEQVRVTASSIGPVFDGKTKSLSALTDSQGSYTINGLYPGSYTLQFTPRSGTNYLSEYFLGKRTLPEATAVSLVSGMTYTANENLEQGKIVGRVVNSVTGLPIQGIRVVASAVFDSGDNNTSITGGSATTDAEGCYEITGLSFSKYKLQFNNYSGDYLSEYYPGTQYWNMAEMVALGSAEIPVANMVMKPLGIVRGTLNRPGVRVDVEPVQLDGTPDASRFTGVAYTDSFSKYEVVVIRNGHYRVKFTPGTTAWLPEYYNDKRTAEAADLVAFGENGVLELNAVMDPALGIISGQVYDTGYHPLSGVEVTAIPVSGTGVRDATRSEVSAVTNTSGVYSMQGVLGQYSLFFDDRTDLYRDQYYDNRPTFAVADIVSVVSLQNRFCGTAYLQVAGYITGTVTDGSTHEAIAGIEAVATPTTADGSLDVTRGVVRGYTDSAGLYKLTNLNMGYYRLEFVSPDGVPYDDRVHTPILNITVNQRALVVNETLVRTVTDTSAPVTTIALSGQLGNESWYTSAVEFTLLASDEGGSRLARTEYSFDGTNWTTYGSAVIVQQEGARQIYFRSADGSGNVEVTQSRTIKIDTVTPTISITSPVNGAQYSLRQVVLAQWAVSDQGSGIHTVTSTVDAGLAVDTSSTGSKTFEVSAVDNAGHTVAQTVVYEVIDRTIPPAAPRVTVSPDHWTNNPEFAISWEAPEHHSAITGAYYKVGAPPTTDTDGTCTTANGIAVTAAEVGPTIYVWLVDEQGNVSRLNQSSAMLRYDNLLPEWPKNARVHHEEITASSILLTWSTASDNIGVVSYRIYADGQLFAETTDTTYHAINLAPETKYEFSVQACDEAGNWTTDGPGKTIKTKNK